MSEFISKYTKMYASADLKRNENMSGFISKFTSEYENCKGAKCENKAPVNKKVSNPNFINVKRGFHV